jgi:predicted N-formylglutamate amidohydrolase
VADYLIVSCEHGGNRIPPAYRQFFQADEDRAMLATHRGFDAGALAMARDLAGRLAAPLVSSTVSRLLVDLNRSLTHPKVHSPGVRAAPAAVRGKIAGQHYRPYRAAVEDLVKAGVGRGSRVVHVSCHSFTPALNGVVRNCDVGLLYDPARPGEADLCRRWQAAIQAAAPHLRVRRNYPYAGKNDGLTTSLRRRFPADAYVGVELEVNQRHVLKPARGWAALRSLLVESLDGVLDAGPRRQP